MGGPLHEIPEDRLHDPREESEFFQSFPEEAKEEMRERWRKDEGHDVDVIELRKQTWKLYVIEMAGFFVFFHIFNIVRSPSMILVALVVGGLTGAVAALLRAGTTLYPSHLKYIATDAPWPRF